MVEYHYANRQREHKMSIFNNKKTEPNTPSFAVCGIDEIDN